MIWHHFFVTWVFSCVSNGIASNEFGVLIGCYLFKLEMKGQLSTAHSDGTFAIFIHNNKCEQICVWKIYKRWFCCPVKIVCLLYINSGGFN
uniref:Putative secreted protein n=1 Tax=Xenopsylla cheopis TaxID=163159 RepID=A0A6M2E1K1_XENCH